MTELHVLQNVRDYAFESTSIERRKFKDRSANLGQNQFQPLEVNYITSNKLHKHRSALNVGRIELMSINPFVVSLSLGRK